MDVTKWGKITPTIKSDGRIIIKFTAIAMGHDLCIVVCGGDLPHLGAAALAQCCASMENPLEMSASVSVLTLLGHKEDQLVSWVAARISRSIGTNVVVLCGIHLDDICKTEIETIRSMVDEWCDEFIQAIS
ncbi:MAG: hypothetical protein H6Q73_4230 [Firmicutes bacterium]|nr:hypothetical protein [Bacillota bacterium]